MGSIENSQITTRHLSGRSMTRSITLYVSVSIVVSLCILCLCITSHEGEFFSNSLSDWRRQYRVSFPIPLFRVPRVSCLLSIPFRFVAIHASHITSHIGIQFSPKLSVVAHQACNVHSRIPVKPCWRVLVNYIPPLPIHHLISIKRSSRRSDPSTTRAPATSPSTALASSLPASAGTPIRPRRRRRWSNRRLGPRLRLRL
jgi:hypothetical protein